MTIDLDTLTLAKGSHADPSEGACVMEAVAMLAGEPFTDHPTCASPVIATFLRTWNDTLDDTTRQTLKPYIPRLVNSRGTQAQETERSWLALDWLIRTHTPAWLRLAGLTDQADTLTNMPAITPQTCPSILPAVEAIRAAGAAAWDAAGAAAWDAAGAAAWAAAGDAARAAAGAAARDAAGAAARDAAWDALEPTVTELQTTAHQLVDRMLAITEAPS